MMLKDPSDNIFDGPCKILIKFFGILKDLAKFFARIVPNTCKDFCQDLYTRTAYDPNHISRLIFQDLPSKIL